MPKLKLKEGHTVKLTSGPEHLKVACPFTVDIIGKTKLKGEALSKITEDLKKVKAVIVDPGSKKDRIQEGTLVHVIHESEIHLAQLTTDLEYFLSIKKYDASIFSNGRIGPALDNASIFSNSRIGPAPDNASIFSNSRIGPAPNKYKKTSHG